MVEESVIERSRYFYRVRLCLSVVVPGCTSALKFPLALSRHLESRINDGYRWNDDMIIREMNYLYYARICITLLTG